MEEELKKSTPEAVNKEVEKALTTANAAGQAGSTILTRQDLESIIVKLSNRGTPIRDMIKRKQGNGVAHAWNRRTVLGNSSNPKNAFYAENGLPTSVNPTYDQKSAAYKQLGLEGDVSGLLIAAGRTFTDVYAEMLEATTRDVIQAEEWAILHGDSTVTNSNGVSSFDGLDTQLTTNVVNLGGALTVAALDKMIKLIRSQGGAPTDIVMSFGVQNVLNEILQTAGDVRVNIDTRTDELGVGLNITYYQSPVGKINVIGDFFVNPTTPFPYNNSGSSGVQGNSTSSVYFLNRNYMAMVDLEKIAVVPLAKIADNERFMVREYTVLEVTAEPWFGILTNVTDPIV